jgi:hypothetical protein
LCFQVVNAVRAQIEPVPASPVVGGCSFVAPNEPTIYRLSAIGEDGRSVQRRLRVEVVRRARILFFQPRQAALSLSSHSAQLCYGVADAEIASIRPTPGTVGAASNNCVAVPASGEFTLTAIGSDRVPVTATVRLSPPAGSPPAGSPPAGSPPTGSSPTPTLQLPDLVAGLQLLGQATVNAKRELEVPIRVIVANRGKAAAGAFKVSVEAEGRTVPFRVNGQQNPWYPMVNGLGPGQSTGFDGVVSLPAAGVNTNSGLRLSATADSCSGDEIFTNFCRVRESDERNNVSAAVRVPLPLPPAVGIGKIAVPKGSVKVAPKSPSQNPK